MRQATRQLRNRRRSQDRKGAAVVEFALIAPLMILLTMGMMEIGRMVMVKQLLINSSREGARMAVLPGSTATEVKSQITVELEQASVSGANIVITPADLSNAPAGTSVTVEVSIEAAAISWIPKPAFSFATTLRGSTTMRRESL